ncbi:OmpA family protein [Kiloniella laminariae]|uniref:OmpA family protein n=1 Tax=Kiloniella laminariae TaxID=454162 RepID=UPI00039C534F|nr:OmpA family protein [Kiloniella laminariae]
MLDKTFIKFLFPLSLLLLAACSAPRGNYVILLAEEDGTVGQASVSNAQGESTLVAANSVVEVPRQKAPKKARELEAETVAKLTAETEAAQPPKPLNFVFFFGFDSTELTGDSDVIFARVLENIKSRETVDISLIGHTDSTGSVEYNRELGLKRADKLRQQLVDNGIPSSLIDIKSLGEDSPLAADEGLDQRALNRRVVMVLR